MLILFIQFIGLHQGNEMAYRPRYGISVSDQATLAFLVASEDARNVAAYTWFFGDNNLLSHAKLPFFIVFWFAEKTSAILTLQLVGSKATAYGAIWRNLAFGEGYGIILFIPPDGTKADRIHEG